MLSHGIILRAYAFKTQRPMGCECALA